MGRMAQLNGPGAGGTCRSVLQLELAPGSVGLGPDSGLTETSLSLRGPGFTVTDSELGPGPASESRRATNAGWDGAEPGRRAAAANLRPPTERFQSRAGPMIITECKSRSASDSRLPGRSVSDH